MHAYAWRGRNQHGDMITGVIDAETDDAVADQLLASGVTPVQISVKGASLSAPRQDWWAALRAGPVTMEDLLLFARQMYTLQRAGVPILRALAGLQASTAKPPLVALLADLRAGLDQGRDLSTSMARHPAVFSPFFVAMIRVGEMTGKLTEVFKRLGEHLEFELDVRARIKQALRYPTMVVVAMALALVVINLFVLPAFANVFQGFKAELPLMTRVLLGFSAWTLAWWPLLLAAAVAAAWGVRAWIATRRGRYLWDRAKLRLPVAGPIVLKATLARFARSFALASTSGVPISQAMTVVAQTVVLQMIAVGEETGEIDTLLVEIAQMYERETDYAIKGLSSAIEPILLLVIGGMVLVLALGVFLPLWSLGQAASGRGA